MSSSGTAGSGSSRSATGPSAKKASARARAAAAREAERKAAKRRRVVLWVVIAAVLLGIGITVVLVVLQSNEDAGGDGQAAGPAGSEGSAIVEGNPDAPVTVAVYQDYMCPACGALHKESGSTLTEEAAAGNAVVHFHTLAFLDRFSQGAKYSTRSANAAACAADQGVFVAYNDLLYANQPAEGTTGLDDPTLVKLGVEAGADKATFEPCVTGLTYGDWVSDVTDNAFEDDVSATPTVRVNGKTVDDTSPEGLRKAIADAAASASASPTPSPSK